MPYRSITVGLLHLTLETALLNPSGKAAYRKLNLISPNDTDPLSVVLSRGK